MSPLAALSLVTESPSADGMNAALAQALAPIWPALLPWLSAIVVAVAMGAATEVVARELQRTGGRRG